MKRFTQSTPTHTQKKKKKVQSQLRQNSNGRIKHDGLVHFRGLAGEKKKRKEKKEPCWEVWDHRLWDNTYNCFCQSNLIISSSHNSFSSKKQKKTKHRHNIWRKQSNENKLARENTKSKQSATNSYQMFWAFFKTHFFWSLGQVGPISEWPPPRRNAILINN